MREPRAINVAVFLDDVMPVNGPLLLIPKSHKAERDRVADYPLLTLDRDTVTRLVQEAEDASGSGVVAPTGKAGTVLMFHGNLVHAVPPNITPYPRKVAYLTLNAVSNGITKFTRAEWMAHRDVTPITAADDGALAEHARMRRVAAE
jgi:ectoine hydroxylase